MNNKEMVSALPPVLAMQDESCVHLSEDENVNDSVTSRPQPWMPNLSQLSLRRCHKSQHRAAALPLRVTEQLDFKR